MCGSFVILLYFMWCLRGVFSMLTGAVMSLLPSGADRQASPWVSGLCPVGNQQPTTVYAYNSTLRLVIIHFYCSARYQLVNTTTKPCQLQSSYTAPDKHNSYIDMAGKWIERTPDLPKMIWREEIIHNIVYRDLCPWSSHRHVNGHPQPTVDSTSTLTPGGENKWTHRLVLKLT